MTKSAVGERMDERCNAWNTLPVTKAPAVIAAEAAIQETQAGDGPPTTVTSAPDTSRLRKREPIPPVRSP